MVLELIQSGLHFTTLILILMAFVAVVIALTIHEFAHALSALAFGDQTAKEAGRLSLNPARHYDPVGSTLFLLFGFGWAKPVPVNPNRMRSPRIGGLLVSLWGPFSNILLAGALALIWRSVVPHLDPSTMTLPVEFGLRFLDMAISLNLYLAFFNLLPLPPLDGSHIITYILPEKAAVQYLQFLHRYGQLLVILIILMGGRLLGPTIGKAVNTVSSLMMGLR